jgi:hypothetical protein
MKPTSPFTDGSPPSNQGHDLSLQNVISAALSSQVDVSPMAANSSLPPYQLRSRNQTMTREYLRDIIQEALDIIDEDLDTAPRG